MERENIRTRNVDWVSVEEKERDQDTYTFTGYFSQIFPPWNILLAYTNIASDVARYVWTF